MLIVPKLDEIQYNILKIISDNKFHYDKQINETEKYIGSLPQYDIYDAEYKTGISADYILHLYNQELISNPRIQKNADGVIAASIGSPIMLTGIGNGYLETTLKIEELIDNALAQLGLPLAENTKIRTKLMNAAKEKGVDILVELIASAMRNGIDFIS